MPPLVAHLLLVLAVAALAGAGLRVAAALGAGGALRVLAAVVVAATAAALTALLLAPVNLGSSPIALTLAAAGCWLAAARWLPDPVPVSAELGAEWRRLPAGIRIAIGAGLGALVAIAAWDLVRPALAGDGLIYHVPLVAAWVAGGDPGSLRAVSTDAPLEAYPLATELLVSWAAGIGRSYVAVSLANPADDRGPGARRVGRPARGAGAARCRRPRDRRPRRRPAPRHAAQHLHHRRPRARLAGRLRGAEPRRGARAAAVRRRASRRRPRDRDQDHRRCRSRPSASWRADLRSGVVSRCAGRSWRRRLRRPSWAASGTPAT